MKKIKLVFIVAITSLSEIIIFPVMALAALLSRFCKKEIDIGLGPEPLINNIYHKKALLTFGYKAETFVNSIYFITNEFDWIFVAKNHLFTQLIKLSGLVYFFTIFRYKCIYRN